MSSYQDITPEPETYTFIVRYYSLQIQLYRRVNIQFRTG